MPLDDAPLLQDRLVCVCVCVCVCQMCLSLTVQPAQHHEPKHTHTHARAHTHTHTHTQARKRSYCDLVFLSAFPHVWGGVAEKSKYACVRCNPTRPDASFGESIGVLADQVAV